MQIEKLENFLNNKFILFFITLLLIIIILYSFNYINSKKSENKNYFINTEIKGKIKSVYFEGDVQNFIIENSKDNNQIEFYLEQLVFFNLNKIQNGDSINKVSGSNIMYIFNKTKNGQYEFCCKYEYDLKYLGIPFTENLW